MGREMIKFLIIMSVSLSSVIFPVSIFAEDKDEAERLRIEAGRARVAEEKERYEEASKRRRDVMREKKKEMEKEGKLRRQITREDKIYTSIYLKDDDLKKYYPLKDGNAWVYHVTFIGETEKLSTSKVKIAGKEFVNNIETVKMVREDGGYDCVAYGSEGIKLYKTADSYGRYVTYKPLLPLLPFDIMYANKYVGTHLYSFFDEKDKLLYNAENTLQINFEGGEDIIVPAGSFQDSFKISKVISWRGKDGASSEYKSVIWLAKDIGIIKRTEESLQLDKDGNILFTEIIKSELKEAVLDGEKLE